MATRPVRYELHIRPLVRLLDRENMAWAFDLWDYDQVRAKADTILLRIQADMPPRPYGGQWPAEWIALFQRWKDEGFLRLDLGAVDPTGYVAARNGDTVTLTGRGATPTSGYRAWLDAVIPEGGPREYVLYWEPPVPAVPASPTLFRAKATFQVLPGATEVVVTDVTGRHAVAIAPAAAPMSVPAGLSQIQPMLEHMGASHVQTVPTAGGSAAQFRLGADVVHVFIDAQGVDIEAPPAVLDSIKRALDTGKRAGPN